MDIGTCGKHNGYPNQELCERIIDITYSYTPRKLKNGEHLTHEIMREHLTPAEIQDIRNIAEIPSGMNQKKYRDALASFLQFYQDNQ